MPESTRFLLSAIDVDKRRAFYKGLGKLGKVESLTRQGQLVAYESTIEKGVKHRELAFRPDGTAMKAD